MTGIHRDTIMRLMIRVGESRHALMQQTMCDLPCKRIQVDEIWTYVGKKQRWVTSKDNPEEVGDMWTFVALDADSKLVPAYLVGKRDLKTATEFMSDLAGRFANRVLLSSDAMNAYVEARERAFGANVDYAQLVKIYEAEPIGPGRYSPPNVVGTKQKAIRGNPDYRHVSTTFVERQNLTMRMHIRRFTRLTNAFSKKVENLRATVALHFAHYNFVRIHNSTLTTPAMAAGVTNKLWNIIDLVDMASN
jgi:IS1 family transposase